MEGVVTELIFNIINITDKQSKQKIRLDLKQKTLEFLTSADEIIKLIMMSEIKYLEENFQDYCIVNMLLEQKKISILFPDVKSRSIFESAVFQMILPNYVITANRPDHLEKINIFISTFNVGSCEPPKDLDSWLRRSLDSQVIAIGLQESKNSSWLESLHKYYSNLNYGMVNVMMMWKVIT